MRERIAWELVGRDLARLSMLPSTCRAAEAALGSWLCQILVAKLKNVVEGILILQILPACQDTLLVTSCRETWAGSEGSWAWCR